jgi:hypothetical protein
MDTIEDSLKLWTDKVLKSKRKEMSPGEVSSMFQQQVLLQIIKNLILSRTICLKLYKGFKQSLFQNNRQRSKRINNTRRMDGMLF